MTAPYISPPDIESYVCLYVTVGSFLSEEEAYGHSVVSAVAPFVKIQMSWDVMPCELINIYRHFSKA